MKLALLPLGGLLLSVAAEYSLALDRIIMASSDPNQPHSYDPNATATAAAVVKNDPAFVGVGANQVFKERHRLLRGMNRAANAGNSAVSINLSTGAATTTSNIYASSARYNSAVNAVYAQQFGSYLVRYDASADTTKDRQYVSALNGVSNIQAFNDSAAVKRIAAVPQPSTCYSLPH